MQNLNSKKRLFNMMGNVDNSFKSKLNESEEYVTDDYTDNDPHNMLQDRLTKAAETYLGARPNSTYLGGNAADIDFILDVDDNMFQNLQSFFIEFKDQIASGGYIKGKLILKLK